MTLVWSMACISVLILVALGFGVYLFEKYKKEYKLNMATCISSFWGLAIAVILIDLILCYDKTLRVPALLAGLGGASIGWLIGIWITPMGNTETTKFSKYWTAIGVGSGFTLKWAIDKAVLHIPWLTTHWFVSTIFAVSVLITVVTVYNSRAYDNSLTIHVRKTPGSTTEVDTEPLTLTTTQTITLYAEVEGVSDSLCRWEIFPDGLGAIDSAGVFKAADEAISGKITAMNLEDPTLSNFINVKIIPAANPEPAPTTTQPPPTAVAS